MKRLLFLAVVALLIAPPVHAETIKINLHSCCVTEDATTKEILPAFRKYYKEKFGKDVDVSASFAGSGTLKNQILGGAPVQVAVLSSELYLDQLKEKGLISSDWRKNPNNGAVIKSVIVFVTRKGNPKGLPTFEDLARPGTKVLYASPDTSGGAQWAILDFFRVHGKPRERFGDTLQRTGLAALETFVNERTGLS